MQKCTWVLVYWKWSDGVALMETFRTDDGISASPDDRLMLVQSKRGEEVDIPRLDPSDAYRTLRAWIAADGSQQKQLEVLSEAHIPNGRVVRHAPKLEVDGKSQYASENRKQTLLEGRDTP